MLHTVVGQSCNINHSRHFVPQPIRTLMDEPIWIGMIVVLMLLFLFGILFLTRRRCSRHFKCCEDTNSILKKQAGTYWPNEEQEISQKSYRKVVEIVTSNTQVHDCSLSWLGTCNSIKSMEVKLDLLPK